MNQRHKHSICLLLLMSMSMPAAPIFARSSPGAEAGMPAAIAETTTTATQPRIALGTLRKTQPPQRRETPATRQA